MPIYAYRCDACGFAKDVLQKVSDAPLTDCPTCGKAEFKKQITAAGFQLKGTGWYVTDFRGGSSAGSSSGGSAASETAAAKSETKSAETKSETPAAPAASASSTTAS